MAAYRIAAVLMVVVALAACGPAPTATEDTALRVTELLGGGDTAGFARALTPRPFVFPADHGAHPEFRTEWWYFTGSLTIAGGTRPLGYQLTFFRNALAPETEPRSSAWATDQAWMAHFALTAPGGPAGGFYSFERFARGAGGLAGAEVEPFRVWLEDWSAEGEPGLPPVRLRAAEGGVGIDLRLAAGKPPVLQGDRGLSRKGQEPGNASFYYSLTRLPTSGTVTLDGDTFQVTGLSWMDREWSTSVLDEGVVGWDWFSLQLDDGRDLMAYQLRRADGTADPLSAGSLVEADGSSTSLVWGDYQIEPLATWRSPRGGRTYPARWRLTLPARQIELEIEPLLADQELSHSFVYWEGAVRFRGRAAGQPVAGRGYVELTGY